MLGRICSKPLPTWTMYLIAVLFICSMQWKLRNHHISSTALYSGHIQTTCKSSSAGGVTDYVHLFCKPGSTSIDIQTYYIYIYSY